MNENENNSLEENRENIEKDNEVVEKQNEKIESRNNSSRKGKREVVVQYRKPSFFTSLLLFLMGVCVTTVALGCFYMFKLKDKTEPVPQAPQTKEENVVEEKEPETKVPEVNLDVNGDFVQGLYKKIPMNFRIENLYNYTKTTSADISNANKMIFILEQMRIDKKYESMSSDGIVPKLTSERIYDVDGKIISRVDKYTLESVEKVYKDTFGSAEGILKQNIETNMGYVFEYVEEDSCYYGHVYAGGGGSPFLEHKIVKVEKSKDGKEIYIYDNFLMIEGEFTTTIYAYSNRAQSPIGNFENPFIYGTYNVKDEVFDYFKDKGMKTFKNTFKLDTTGNYYWYSTEPVNELN